MVYTSKVKIRTGGRNSITMTIDAFKSKIIEKEVKELMFRGMTKPQAEKKALMDIEKSVIYSCNIENDCSIEFDTENISIEEEYMSVEPGTGRLSEILGFHEINGFSFCGVNAGGDWEDAVFFIVYYDGKKFRAYSPVVGNNYNLKEKSAIGNNSTDPKDSNCSIELMFKDFTNRITIGGKTIEEISAIAGGTSASPLTSTDEFKFELEELLGTIKDLAEDEIIETLVDTFTKKYDLDC